MEKVPDIKQQHAEEKAKTLTKCFKCPKVICLHDNYKNLTLDQAYDKNNEQPYVDQIFINTFEIGQGSFSFVFKGLSTSDDNLYAIKVSNYRSYTVSINEIKVLQTIKDHENIVKFVLAWEQARTVNIQLELCWLSLDVLIVRYNGLPENVCWSLAADMLKALEHLHSYNYAHLNIKPGNILITKNSVFKLADFGSAEEIDPNTNMTKQEGDYSNMCYIAIEGLGMQYYGTFSDVFSLGLVLMVAASNAELVSNGPSWEYMRISATDHPTFASADLSDEYREMVRDMTLRTYLCRPSIKELLDSEKIVETLLLHQTGRRFDFVSEWQVNHSTSKYGKPCQAEYSNFTCNCHNDSLSKVCRKLFN